MLIKDVGLICEGGGTKAAYTSGVLHCFIDNDMFFEYSVGISAGTANLISYLAKQPKRLEYMAIDLAVDKKTIGLNNILKEGSFFGLSYIYDNLEKHVPLDREAFENNGMRLDTGLYDLENDKIIYVNKSYNDGSAMVKAACALAVLCRPYTLRGHKYLDAGIIDMIPIEQSIRQGMKKHLFISTKEENFDRKPASAIQINACKMRYPKYPMVAKHLKNRHEYYEAQWSVVKKLENEGNCLVLRPTKDLQISRTTQDRAKLQEWYRLGYEDTQARLEEIKQFCK